MPPYLVNTDGSFEDPISSSHQYRLPDKNFIEEMLIMFMELKETWNRWQ